jgi:hypothetical protein
MPPPRRATAGRCVIDETGAAAEHTADRLKREPKLVSRPASSRTRMSLSRARPSPSSPRSCRTPRTPPRWADRQTSHTRLADPARRSCARQPFARTARPSGRQTGQVDRLEHPRTAAPHSTPAPVRPRDQSLKQCRIAVSSSSRKLAHVHALPSSALYAGSSGRGHSRRRCTPGAWRAATRASPSPRRCARPCGSRRAGTC